MMALALFSWWYTAGWGRAAARVGGSVKSVLESFSVGLLARTLFDPFRQIDAGSVHGSLDVQMRAFGDRLFSRVFGAFIRSIFIILGLLCALGAGLLGVVIVLLWPLVPLLPVVGLVLTLSGLTL